jgi:hypothetical protein
MSRINNKAEEIVNESSASLANSASLPASPSWADLGEASAYLVSVFADSYDGLNLVIESSESDGGGGVDDLTTTTPLTTAFLSTLPTRERYFRFSITNTSGGAVTNVKFFVKAIFNAGTGASVFPVGIQPADFSPAMLTRSVTSGQQPDGDYVNTKQDGSAASTSSTLSADGTYTSDWTDTDGWNTIDIFVSADVESANQGIEIQFTDDVQAGTPTERGSAKFEFNAVDVKRGFKNIRIPTTLDGFRVVYTNGSTAQASFYLDATLRVQPENGIFNSAGALITGTFEREVALGNVSNYTSDSKYGRNPDIDTTTFPEDVWNGGGDYTGHNPTANENLETFSASANDAGSLVSSGTLTGGDDSTAVDTGATFVTDGVAVGDLLVNDTQGIHGVITSVDSETQVTVFDMRDGEIGEYTNKSGDTYRIATTSGTGAAVVKWGKILNSDFEKQTEVYIIMNGTTGVTTTGDFYRLTRGRVVLAGSGGGAAGDITARQATTTANVFAVMPSTASNTLICADTVPADQTYLIESVSVAITRASGAAGSANVSLRTRPFGEVFTSKRSYEPSTGGPVDENLVGGIPVSTGTDIKIRVDSVSDNNTIATGSFEYLTIDI